MLAKFRIEINPCGTPAAVYRYPERSSGSPKGVKHMTVLRTSKCQATLDQFIRIRSGVYPVRTLRSRGYGPDILLHHNILQRLAVEKIAPLLGKHEDVFVAPARAIQDSFR